MDRYLFGMMNHLSGVRIAQAVAAANLVLRVEPSRP
jgi:hypothetical protein